MNIEVTAPEQVWVSDITYIRTQSGFMYLSIVTDEYSKKIIGYHLSHKLEAKGCVSALKMALTQRRFPERKLIHHSDRGIQYCSRIYTRILEENGIQISMSAKASPQQNPSAERLNRTLKYTFRMRKTFANYQEAMSSLVDAVYVYNHIKPHSSCDQLTPAEAHLREGPLKKHWKPKKRKRKKELIMNGGASPPKPPEGLNCPG